MRRWTLSLGMGSALVACLVIGVARSAGAATLDFTGTLTLPIFPGTYPPGVIPGGGSAVVTDDGSLHLLSLLLPSGAFGPISMSLPTTNHATAQSVRLTAVANLTGSFGGISGGPPGGGSMGLSGLAKICYLGFVPCAYAQIPIPLTPTAGGAGFGIGGMQSLTGGHNLTMHHAPWTLGQPVMTLHTPNTTISTPALPGGFAHGPASSTAQPSGVVQLVTVTKVFTSLTGAYPEFPLPGILTLHFVPEPGTLLLLGLGVAALAAHGRRKPGR